MSRKIVAESRTLDKTIIVDAGLDLDLSKVYVAANVALLRAALTERKYETPSSKSFMYQDKAHIIIKFDTYMSAITDCLSVQCFYAAYAAA
jgi:hypothetical protein